MAEPYDVYSVAFGSDAIEITYQVPWPKRHGGIKKLVVIVPRRDIEPQVRDVLDSIYEIIDWSEDEPGPDTFTAPPDRITEVLAKAMGLPTDQAVAKLMEAMTDDS
jgi:hypothetical protein